MKRRWRRQRGGGSRPPSSKAHIRRGFHPDKDDWKQMVYERSVDVMDRALAGLSS
jgi:hypothetical protein